MSNRAQLRLGLYATESMGMEKGYLHWKVYLLYERDPLETGLHKFVDLTKGDFVRREALLQQMFV
ncbi:MAG: dimethylglycine dehydrogenase [bacterium]